MRSDFTSTSPPRFLLLFFASPRVVCASSYADDDLATHLRGAPGVFDLYLGGRKQLLQKAIYSEAEQQMEGRLKAELARLEAMSEKERKVYALRKRIIDEILTLRCGHCSAAFLDFDDCFAIKCESCPWYFCGWCLTATSTESGPAHTHVAQCAAKPANAGRFYASSDASVSEQMFAAQNKARREKMLRKFFAEEVEPAILENVQVALVADLSDPAIGLGEFIAAQLR